MYLYWDLVQRNYQNTHINKYLHSLQGGQFAEGADGARWWLKDSIWRSWQRYPNHKEQLCDRNRGVSAVQRWPGPKALQAGRSMWTFRLILRQPGEDQRGPEPTCVQSLELCQRTQCHCNFSKRSYRQYPERPAGEHPLQCAQAELLVDGLAQRVPQLHRAGLHGWVAEYRVHGIWRLDKRVHSGRKARSEWEKNRKKKESRLKHEETMKASNLSERGVSINMRVIGTSWVPPG